NRKTEVPIGKSDDKKCRLQRLIRVTYLSIILQGHTEHLDNWQSKRLGVILYGNAKVNKRVLYLLLKKDIFVKKNGNLNDATGRSRSYVYLDRSDSWHQFPRSVAQIQ